jgi:hypothetical protein
VFCHDVERIWTLELQERAKSKTTNSQTDEPPPKETPIAEVELLKEEKIGPE